MNGGVWLLQPYLGRMDSDWYDGTADAIYQNIDFVRNARAAGAQAQLQVWPGMIHVFQQFPAELPEARNALAAGGQFIAAQLDAASTRKTST